MSKNSTLGDTLLTSENILKDENFKDVIRYKAIAALLIKFTIPEFYDKTLVEISRAIIDKVKVHNEKTSDVSILEDEVDLLGTEAGTKDEKNTIYDTVFSVKIGNETTKIKMNCIDSEITVNTEMQSTTSESSLGYNLVSRAIYYGASLLRDTVPAGDTKYTNIHKVYTIWFCAKKLNLQEFPETDGKYIHRYGFRRFYDDIPQKDVGAEKFADLIEVVLVELPKLRREDSQTTDMVYKLFFDTQNIVNSIEAVEKVNLTKIRKGVKDMIDYEARTEQREFSLISKMVESQKAENISLSYESIIAKLARQLELDSKMVQRLQTSYSNK